jgi:ABC-type lipoprotein release transport system permease subunit
VTAQASPLVRLVARHGLGLGLAGAAPGLALAAAAAVVMGLVASIAPALRASRTDPARVLRRE